MAYPPNGGDPLVDGEDRILAAHINDIVDELGDDPKGGYATVEARLDAMALGGGGDGASPALIVAANNSTPLAKSRADVVCDGSDDQTAINAAITAANNTYGGGTDGDQYGSVLLCDGVYDITGPILLPSRGFSIGGLGYGAVLLVSVSAASFTAAGRGSEKAVIKIANDNEGLNSNSMRVHDLFIDVDYDDAISGVVLSQTSEPDKPASEWGYPQVVNAPDSAHVVQNVRVFGCKYGVYMESSSGGRACHIVDCYISITYSAGIYVNASDAYISGTVVITGNASNAVGFDIHGGSTRLVGCKASYLARSGNIGFQLSSSRASVTGCEAQDCTNGFVSTSQDSTFVGCRADNQVAAGGNYVDPDVGFDLSGGANNQVVVGCSVMTRGGAGWDVGIDLPPGSGDHHLVGMIIDDGCATTAVANNGTPVTSNAGLPSGFNGTIVVQGDKTYSSYDGGGGGGSSYGAAITRVGGAANGANDSSVVVTLPDCEDNDIAVACCVYNQSVGAPSTPSGWTLLQVDATDYVEYSASMQARIYWKVLESSDSSVTFSATSQKLAAAVEVFRGARGLDVWDGIDSHVTPSLTLNTEGMIASFGCERSSTPSTAVSASPTGMTAGESYFNSGSGSTSIATAYQHLIQPSGTFNPGDWSFDGSQPGTISFTIALKI